MFHVQAYAQATGMLQQGTREKAPGLYISSVALDPRIGIRYVEARLLQKTCSRDLVNGHEI